MDELEAMVARMRLHEELKENLLQLAATPEHRLWRLYPDLIADAVANMRKLPGLALVPHMRSVADYPSDSCAIAVPPTAQELESAHTYVQTLAPQVEVQDFLARGIEDAVACPDRSGGGTLLLASDMAWGLERVRDEGEARLACRLALWRAQAEAAWLDFRGGGGSGQPPEAFKGANSRPLEGEPVSC